MNLSLDDAMELGQLLQFLDDWLATDHKQLSTSLARFTGIDGLASGRSATTSPGSCSCSARPTGKVSSHHVPPS